MGIDPLKVWNAIAIFSKEPVSLSLPIGEEDDELEACIEDTVIPRPEDELDSKALCEDVTKLLTVLDERSRKVIELRFGIDCEPLSLEKVSQVLGLTRERIRQIEAKALRTLRPHAGNLRCYISDVDSENNVIQKPVSVTGNHHNRHKVLKENGGFGVEQETIKQTNITDNTNGKYPANGTAEERKAWFQEHKSEMLEYLRDTKDFKKTQDHFGVPRQLVAHLFKNKARAEECRENLIASVFKPVTPVFSITITDRDLVGLPPEEFARVWEAIGFLFRIRLSIEAE